MGELGFNMDPGSGAPLEGSPITSGRPNISKDVPHAYRKNKKQRAQRSIQSSLAIFITELWDGIQSWRGDERSGMGRFHRGVLWGVFNPPPRLRLEREIGIGSPEKLQVQQFLKLCSMEEHLHRLPCFEIAKPNFRFHIDSEWCKFLDHLFRYRKVAIVRFEGWELYLQPPTDGPPHGFGFIRALCRPVAITPAKRDRREEPEQSFCFSATFEECVLNSSTAGAAEPPSSSTSSFLQERDILAMPGLRKLNSKDNFVPSGTKLIPRRNFSQQEIKTRSEMKEVTNGTTAPLANELRKPLLKNARTGPSSYTYNFLEHKKARVTGDFSLLRNEESGHASCSTEENTQRKPSSRGFINGGNTAAFKDLSVSKVPSNDCDGIVQRKLPQSWANPDEETSCAGGESALSDIQKKIRSAQLRLLVETTLGFVHLAGKMNATRVDVNIEEFFWQAKMRNLGILKISDDGQGMSPDVIEAVLRSKEMRIRAQILILTQVEKTFNIGFVSRIYDTFKHDFVLTNVAFYRDSTGGQHRLVHKDIAVIQDVVQKHSPFHSSAIESEFLKMEKSKLGSCIFVCPYEDDISSNVPGERMDSVRYVQSGWVECEDDGINLNKIDKEILIESLYTQVRTLYLVLEMKIFIQDMKVDKSLKEELECDGKQYSGLIDNEEIMLSLVYLEKEFQSGRSGIFLYNQNQLLEPYVKVGKMIENLSYGLGVVGAVDITALMDSVDEMNYFQKPEMDYTFILSKSYNLLMEWLASIIHEYCDSFAGRVDCGVSSLAEVVVKDKQLKVGFDQSSNCSESVQSEQLIPKKEVIDGDICALPCDTTSSVLCKKADETKDLMNGREFVVAFEKNAADLIKDRNNCFYPLDLSNKQVLQTSRDGLRGFNKSCPGVEASIPHQKHSARRMHVGGCRKLNSKHIEEVRFRQVMELPTRNDSNVLPASSKLSMVPLHETSLKNVTTVDTAATKTSVDVELRPFDSDQMQHSHSGIPSENGTTFDDEYEVEKILDSKRIGDQTYYLVHWTGYDINESTWEPSSHLCNAREKLDEYYA